MNTIQTMAVIIALSAVAIIGLDLLMRPTQRRREGEGSREDRAALPEGVDPATLRKRRPLTQRMSGAVLLAAVAVMMMVVFQLQ